MPLMPGQSFRAPLLDAAMPGNPLDFESLRLEEDARRIKNWKRWGPYLSERQWGTVREDYSPNGDSWGYFTHEQARSRAYRWGEDGLLGICDRRCRICFALALWNGKDPILKERLFGLTNPEGNHGEDVKEEYFYVDATPTHSYLKALYKYPQAEFPYAKLRSENARRGRLQPEYELMDTGVFEQNRYFDVHVEYAKAAPDDILIRITVANRGPEAALLHVLPTVWFRNSWAWGCTHDGCEVRSSLRRESDASIRLEHVSLGHYVFSAAPDAVTGVPPPLLFTENETNQERLFGVPNKFPHVKDAFHDYVIHGNKSAVNLDGQGTKAAAHFQLDLQPGAQAVMRLRLNGDAGPRQQGPFTGFDEIFAQRIKEADAFYDARTPVGTPDVNRRAARQAYAGLCWSKQFYHMSVKHWLEGDPATPPPPPSRKNGRDKDWGHLFNYDVISMPDKWEFPWYAAWDLAFHMLPFAKIDPYFAKAQLVLFLREWYMHPNGQLPAYEFEFSDVNPPVHAWSCWRVYKMTGPRGKRDRLFLERVFQKLLINFTWWVNRKDPSGKNLFGGGFLGLDNIGVFDRNKPLPNNGQLAQADGTAWMAVYCATMLSMALELAREDSAYEDVASKFFEHFVAVSDAINTFGGTGLWHEEDGFYYDQLTAEQHECNLPLRIRSLVGLIPLLAVEIIDGETLERLPGFRKRLDWFIRNRDDLSRKISYFESNAEGRAEGAERAHAKGLHLLAIPSRERLRRVLEYVLDENEFFSDFGIRSLSRVHREHPYIFPCGTGNHTVSYTPGESDSDLFGGNSNWRGPVWMPLNYLLIEALERYHHFYGDAFTIECPTGSSRQMNLKQVANELTARISRLFLPDATGRRPCHGDRSCFSTDPHWKNLLLFNEYFHGDNGRGLGAGHQTGWTALAALLLEQTGNR